jgi:hypothetical protein
VRVRANGRDIHRQIKGGSSYASAHDLRLLVGVGPCPTVAEVEIRWPSGLTTRLENLSVRQDNSVTEP